MRLSRWEFAILGIIKRFIRKYGPRGAWFSQAWLARKIGRCIRTVGRAISGLVRRKLIVVRQRYEKTAIYELSDPENVRAKCPTELPSGVSVNLRRERKQYSTVEQVPVSKKLVLPPPTLTNELGRIAPNPVWQRCMEALRAARWRISSARNPVAYEQAILRGVLL